MGKAILEFNLPEDDSDFKLACIAGKLYSALWNIKNSILRPRWKHKEYENEAIYDEVEAIYEEVCAEIGSLLDEVE